MIRRAKTSAEYAVCMISGRNLPNINTDHILQTGLLSAEQTGKFLL